MLVSRVQDPPPDSYWDTVSSGVGTSAAGTGKTTTELTSPTSYTSTAGNGATAIYTSWNVDVDNADGDDDLTTGTDDPWDFGDGTQYPVLKFGGLDVARAAGDPARRPIWHW